MQRMKHEKLLFFTNFIKNPLRNASLIPSSEKASRSIIEDIDFDQIKTIIELGPGNGCVTEEILKKARPDARIVLIELEDTYVNLLRNKYGDRIIVEKINADRLEEVMDKYNFEKADLIVSGLPFTLPKDSLNRLHNAIKRQTERGTIFRYFTYMPLIMKQYYKSLPVMKYAFVPLNFPPMWIYGIN